MITIDGSTGEGGGQILRTSVALSLVTGTPVRITKIRAGRAKPGLMRQHLTAVRAAAEVGRAEVSGAEIGSREIVFRPGKVEPGEYAFDVGSAGSTTLVFQTVLPALLAAGGPSRVALKGGTHNPHAPPFDFLDQAYLPLVRRMGPSVIAELGTPGFYPAGGGSLRVAIEPAPLGRLDLLERGAIVRRSVSAMVVNLPPHIADREIEEARAVLGWDASCAHSDVRKGPGPGNALSIAIGSEHVTEVFTGFGEKGIRAELVAGRAANEARDYLDAGVPVGEHLADQLILPMALGQGGSFRTTKPSLHTLTHIDLLERLLRITVEQVSEKVWQIAVSR